MSLRHAAALNLPAFPGKPKPRTPLAKEPLRQPPGQDHLLLVKFRDALLARSDSTGGLVMSADTPDSSLQQVIEKFGLTFSPSQTATAEDLTRLEARALANTRTEPADLGGVLAAHPSDASKQGVWDAAQALQKLDAVEFVALSSLDEPPPPPLPYDIAPPSGLLTSYQDYRGANGINMDAAWAAYGARGGGVRVTDCEYRFNAEHEDLRNIVTAQPWVSAYHMEYSHDHGTAVLGILAAADNDYGMTGMVPDASFWFYGDLSTVNGQIQSRSATVTAALAASAPGDVVLLEMQTTGALGGYGPAEYDMNVWLAVKTGTDAGIHVVAAAGNGKEDLDDPAYDAYHNRGDSGSVIVGAGTRNRSRADFSTYGARVNVQGWGAWDVATLGYGKLEKYGDDDNQAYTGEFSGTSSASPIVTAAVAAIESIARHALHRSLTPVEMRQLLISTGKPQTGDLSTPIGPLPDVTAALDQLLAGFPTIASATPNAAAPGDVVVINGTGFSGASAVAFGGVNATTFTVVNPTTLNATLPANARTGRLTVTTAAGTGVSIDDFRVIAGASGQTATAAPQSLTGFATRRGTPSSAQTFVVSGQNLDSYLSITAPAGFEVSLDGTNYASGKIATASAPADSSTNYTTNWITGANAGLGFGAWAISAVEGTNYYAGHFLGDPGDAGITGMGADAFGLYANPENSPAAVHADRPLARPLKIGDTLQFQWGLNWDTGSQGTKGFVLYSGGAGMTEIFRAEQGDYPGAIVFAAPGASANTGIAYGTAPMTWKFTRTGTNTMTVSSTGRGGGTNVVFSTNVTIPGAPDAFRWYASQLDNSSGQQSENDARQPYFNNIGIQQGFSGGGALPSTTIHVRLATNAPAGNVAGNITLASAGTTLATVAAGGVVAPDYDTWAQGYGLDPLNDGAPGKDPDTDGFSNLSEYFFGTNPVASTASLLTWIRSGNDGVLQFAALVAGATYTVETRPDLATGSWADSGITPAPSADQSGVPAGYRRMECTVPLSGKAFYRVKATLP